MPEGALDDWIRCAATMLKPGGQLALIHRAESLAEIFAALSTRFGAIKVTMVHPVTERPANRVIVVATKSSRAPTQITPPLIVHVRPGEWTPAIEAALRTGAPWRG
jgi:tRNA1(Val) A37 N6-methylase TrmN6